MPAQGSRHQQVQLGDYCKKPDVGYSSTPRLHPGLLRHTQIGGNTPGQGHFVQVGWIIGHTDSLGKILEE